MVTTRSLVATSVLMSMLRAVALAALLKPEEQIKFRKE